MRLVRMASGAGELAEVVAVSENQKYHSVLLAIAKIRLSDK